MKDKEDPNESEYVPSSDSKSLIDSEQQTDVSSNEETNDSYNESEYSASYSDIIQNNIKKIIPIILVDETTNSKKRKYDEIDDKTYDLINKIKSVNIDQNSNILQRIVNSRFDDRIKNVLLNMYDDTSTEKMKYNTYIEKVLKLPIGIYKEINPSNNIPKFMTNLRNNLDKAIAGHIETKEEIIDYISSILRNPQVNSNILALQSPPGLGKCFKKDTPILMFDGNIKMVQDICIGDILMGDDSQPRNVLSLGSGEDIMYKISNDRHEQYTVNSEHIICMKYIKKNIIKHNKKYKTFMVQTFNTKNIKLEKKNFSYRNKDKNEIFQEAKKYLQENNSDMFCEITVKKYITLNKYIKKNLRGYYAEIDFKEKYLDFDPYTLGLWLGNLYSNKPLLILKDKNIINHISKYLIIHDCLLKKNSSDIYEIVGVNKQSNFFLDYLKKNNLLDNKHIPLLYKSNSYDKRMKLLAGILDSSECLSQKHSKFKFTQPLKNVSLLKDIFYLAKSLGFVCHKVKTTETFFVINIYGKDLNKIPCNFYNTDIKNAQNVSLFKIKIEELKKDKYYGFTIDGNMKFVLGNFIVTHNTRFVRALGKALDLPFHQISFGGMTDPSILTGHDFTYIGSKPGKIYDIITKSKSMNSIIMLDEIDKIGDRDSSSKTQEINGILTHMLDKEQNMEFYDNYLGLEFPLDLSKILFIATFNNEYNVDPVILNRMKVIKIKESSLSEKIEIVKQFTIPELIESYKLEKFNIFIDDKTIKYIIINKTVYEPGMRNINKNIRTIFGKINTLLFLESASIDERNVITKGLSYSKVKLNKKDNKVIIDLDIVDSFLPVKSSSQFISMMYN